MFTADWFFDLEKKIKDLGAASDAQSFDEIREILINNKSYSELLFLNRKYSLLDSINSLIVSLEDFDEFYDEYFDLLRIQEITEYILNMRYDDITLENILFIQDLYDLFFNVLSFKINLIKKYDFKIENNFEDEYLIEYLKFKNEFHKRDYYFLKNILKIDYHNKDELINYCKFMKE